MKRLITLLLIVSIVISLAGCDLIDGFGQKLGKDPSDGAPSGEAGDRSEINGYDLAQFAIVYSADASDYTKRAAEYIKEEIKERTELDLPIITDAEPTRANEIVVGETTREVSKRFDHKESPSAFTIMARGGSVAMEAEYFVIAAAAYFFIESYVPSDNFSASVPKSAVAHMPIAREAKNFILLIGDGMGVYQTRLFEALENDIDYGDGEDIFYGYYLPYFAYSRTGSLTGTTDSAAGATALATGYKTLNGHVGQDADHNELTSLTELAASLGKSTAVMSTEYATGATPSAFSAHADDRDLKEDIEADQEALKAEYGTIINCYYNKYNRLGISDIEWRVTSTLDALDDDEDGFFLMYEEAHIDKNSHNNNLKSTFEALVRFNQVIARFMEYAYYNPDTAVIITADHETGGLAPDSDGFYVYSTDGHTGANVPVFVHGYGMSIFDNQTIENTQIPMTIASFMGVDDFGDTTAYSSLKQ